MGDDLAAALDAFLARHETELIELRRDLHAHPEPANAERRTTEVVAERLARAGLRPVLFSGSTGLQADIGHGEPRIALRADLDALPMDDEKSVSYRSTIPGFCHACGHDAHTAMLVGAGEFLAELAASRPLRGGVRLIFQPAEETASGAKQVIAAGALDGVSQIFALHCDPRLDVGRVGIRAGAITAACDKVRVTLAGPGGHTARPHLTADVVYALGKVVTEVPAALTRRVDPRAGLSLVWGHVNAGTAANAIPDGGIVEGTLRCLDAEVWRSAVVLIEDLVQSVAAPYGVIAKVEYLSAVPPTVNEVTSAALVAAAASAVLGPGAVTDTLQSLGGEDFAWYLEMVPGAMARIGTRAPGARVAGDLHQPVFDIDERAIGAGVRVLASIAVAAGA
ncbi:amidohydrolase [Trebonia kvetii]|uniref:Amidohydrolase n=1 Tax=Trebonia kvetii TaxID=2480626 RepID=A0A6P2C0X8_9ACTN|nr:amidohydrolase [Trebonia kvetii]TVZ04136.1 amidohydrolase [Trebonia kvetii]